MLDDIRLNVKKDKQIDIDEFVSAIYSQTGMDEIFESNDPLDLKLSWEQVDELAKHPLFTIGGHTVEHCIMSHLNDVDLELEVETSISMITENTSMEKVNHYSYPEGLDFCYSDKVIEVLRSKGIICSPTAISGSNDITTDLFHLKRINVT
jgi:hypothetical protein